MEDNLQNKPNFMRFYALNADSEEKQTQTKPIQTQFKPIFTTKNRPQTQNKPNFTRHSLSEGGQTQFMLVKPPKKRLRNYEIPQGKRK